MNSATHPMAIGEPALAGGDGLPLHVRLKDEIIRGVRSGRFQAGSPILSERELCEHYAVSRTTVRKAIADLVHAGWLYSVSGKGTFVASPPLKQEIEPLVGFSADLRRQGLSVETRVLTFQRIDADDDLARLLDVRAGSAIVQLSRLRRVAGSPMAVQTVFIPEHRCPGILGFDLAARSLYDILRQDYDLRLTSGTTSIEAGLADGCERDHLELPDPSPVLRTQQVTLLDDGSTIELCRSSFHGRHFSLHMSGAQARVAAISQDMPLGHISHTTAPNPLCAASARP
ncbi:GntR family transcriptional regulator [Sandaracinobacteroides saxicola]|uniref:GntR family transcriptional regulator n=1 Tax=Sandaracinobacteroides saxicola TaxID=2759707 RepID=A0A7G5IM42_9SPHN|nr:GntR family transcriptional regulator [Sandaracinobacteroides saxicola]QMW24434.1 GntR family transcriptional regulator [Sandaracinobacteroides saxicola]